ncbi:MAG: nucleotidyltransferase substrate binding protein [Kiritimatiellia bacterium]
MIEYDKFQKSLKHLELQFQNYKTLSSDLPELMREAVSESVVQRFEVCYDCMWKVLKRYLAEQLGVPEVPNSPKPIFRLAFENKLFTSSLDQWLGYADARVATSHDYSGEKAAECIERMEGFIEDAIGLYQTMSGETWE